MGLKNKNNSAVFTIDLNNSSLRYYAVNANGHIVQDARQISAKVFTPEFYEKITVALKEITSKYTPASAANTTIVLPDSYVFNNCATFPTLKGQESKASYNAYVANTYKNIKDLKLIPYKAISTKQYYTMCITGVNNNLVNDLKNAFANARIVASNVTFASNACACALSDLTPKIKNDTYLFLDIKKREARFVLVYKGRTIAFYALPFGYEILDTKPAAEDVLLYNQTSELVVVNAKEIARQKALSMSGADNVMNNANTEEESLVENEDGEENAFSGSEMIVAQRPAETIKTLPKKVARRLPKFMQREVPEEDEGKVYENFRLFIKWTLELLNGNDKLFGLAKPNKVYVNMPSDFNYLFEMTNEDEKENGIKFVSASLGKVKEEIAENLELYGGLFAKDNKQSILF